MIKSPFPNRDYPPCKFSIQKLKDSPPLQLLPEVQSNPNCNPQNDIFVDKDNVVYQKKESVLFVNYFNYFEHDSNLHDFIILLPSNYNKDSQSLVDVQIQGFLEQKVIKEGWSFFALSADYQTGQFNIYYKQFGDCPALSQNFNIQFPEFQVAEHVQIIIAGVESTPFFASASGFMGDIAFIDYGQFYTDQL